MFADEKDRYTYVVTANDQRQGVRRAKRQHLEATGSEPPTGPHGEPARVLGLTPKQEGGRFLPRIDGREIGGEPCETSELAVEASVAWLESRQAGTV
jgi:hypothetical protein